MTWEITEPATQVFRKYNTAGVSGSGLHTPSLVDFETWGTETEARMLLALGFSVLDRDLSTPPGAPSTGDKYIVGNSPAGGWSLFAEDDVALWNGAAWENLTPAKGWHLYCEDEAVVLLFNGTAWVDPIVVAGLVIPLIEKRAVAATYMVNGAIVESRVAGAMTIAIKTVAGADPSAGDPVYFIFRNPTAANGSFDMHAVTAALSLTVPAGATLGFLDGVAGRLWLCAIANSGTVELGVVNCLSGTNIYPLGQLWNFSTTAIGSGSDSAHIPYSANARSGDSYAVLGYLGWESGLATAGTWNASPTRIQLFGPGVPLPGHVIQTQGVVTGAVATGAGTIPDDDTIPQSNEGDEYMSKAITPTSSANVLSVRTQATFANSASVSQYAALFRDSGANAVASFRRGNWASGIAASDVTMEYDVIAGFALSTTFKLRSGGSGAGTTTFNGAAGARKFGGSLQSYIKINEIMA